MLTWSHCQILLSHLMTIPVASLFMGTTKAYHVLYSLSFFTHIFIFGIPFSLIFCIIFLPDSIATAISKILIIVSRIFAKTSFFFVRLGSIILLHKFPFTNWLMHVWVPVFCCFSVSFLEYWTWYMCTDFLVSYYLSVVCQCRISRHSVINGFFMSFTQSALNCSIFFHNFFVEVVCSNYLILNCQIIPSVSPLTSPYFSHRYDHSFCTNVSSILPANCSCSLLFSHFSFLPWAMKFLIHVVSFRRYFLKFSMFVIILILCSIGLFW